MSSRPIDPDLGLKRLTDDGFRIEVRDQHLLLHDVPYVTSSRQISRGALICTYLTSGNTVLPPDNHQVWWTGEYPCLANGTPIEQIRNEDQAKELFPGCSISHRFSNKPDGIGAFPDYYSKLLHYVLLIQSQAQAIDPDIDARGVPQNALVAQTSSPFAYPDTASARASIQSTAGLLSAKRVAIIGLGGTGSYILDQVAKTPVRSIDLYDGDIFQSHNAFRSPGAASAEDIARNLNKAEYFKMKYESMHTGIVSHPVQLSAQNISELIDLDFVFVCVDRGSTRRIIFEHLLAQRVPFIDVGLNLRMMAATGKLLGICRCTLCAPEQNAHFSQYVPLDDETGDEIYQQNIQIADMNAMNAQLAVMKWKQFCGFYQDDFRAFNLTFTVNTMSLARDVMVPRSDT